MASANAKGYSSERGHPAFSNRRRHEPVRVRATAHGGHVAILIADRGPGIPRDQLARVFEPFQRLGDRSSQAGVGLGLAVARGFVRAMGGELELDDTPGGGLSAIVLLPVVQP